MSKFVQYTHHDREVWTREDLKGKHREYCLCFKCKKLDLKSVRNNCPIARDTFDNCLTHGLTTPIFECPKFDELEDENNAQR